MHKFGGNESKTFRLVKVQLAYFVIDILYGYIYIYGYVKAADNEIVNK